MNMFKGAFLGALIGLVLASGVDAAFLGLFNLPFVDAALLLFFSTAAFGYLAFYVLTRERESVPSAGKGPWSFTEWLREHAAGLLLAVLFFAVYVYLGMHLNFAGADTVDNFLDADNSSWARRIAAPDGYLMEMRGPHPFAYFIFRPFGLLLHLFTQNPVLSSTLLNSLAGSLAVFLAWFFIKHQTGHRVYAGLVAALLGLSTAHIFFGSVIETYIFSAAALMAFFVLVQSNSSLGSQVALGVITFGITLTNFVQTFIGFVISRPKLKEIIRFAGLTISIGVVLSMLHAILYPSSKLFFLPSDAQSEEEFAISIFNSPSWRAIGRVLLLVRTILLYTVIAPKPYVFGEEVGGTFPRFNFFKIAPETFSYSSYSGLGNLLVLTWSLLLLAAGVYFLVNLVRTRKVDVTFSFVLCILFNFVLHLNYGYEPFLYSPDWAYALILFVAVSLAPLAKYRAFQAGLLLFLIGLAYNQFQFFVFIMQTISPFVK